VTERIDIDRRGKSAGRARPILGGESGVAVIVVMMFCLIFLILAVALYWLVTSQTRSTETERSDVKSFNVAEAGVDAGMLALQLDWPAVSTDAVAVDEGLLKLSLQAGNDTLWDPSRSSADEFIQVAIYDNSVDDGHVTVTTPPDDSVRLGYDANADGMMYVDATSNVDDDRHRILILAERQKWELSFPENVALYSEVVDSNGQGYGIEIEVGNGGAVYYDVNDPMGKGIEPGAGVDAWPWEHATFESIFPESMRRALLGMAIKKSTYFTDGEAAEDFLMSGEADGSVVYIKSDVAVDIGGDTRMGTVEKPVVVVIDTPDGSDNIWDMKGTADLYGILITVGNSTLRGTCTTHGAMYCSGTFLNKGNGTEAELNYNYDVIMNLNRQYVISVNIVPNSWEEYALPN